MINYIKTLSDNKKVQELLIKTIGNILLKEKNIEKYVEKNENKIIHIRDFIVSIIENNEQWKKPRVLTLEALNNVADKYFEKKNNKIQIIELNEKEEKLIADLDNYYIVQMLTPEALDNESKVMQHCIGHGGYDKRLKDPDYQYFSLRDRFNKAHCTLETKNNKVLQLQGKQNDVPDKKYLEILIPWLVNNNYYNIPWKDVGEYYENGKWINFKNIVAKKNIDYYISHISDKFFIFNIINDKSLIYFNEKYKNKIIKDHIIADKDKIILNTYIKKSFSIDKLQKIYDDGYQKIPFHLFNCILNIKDNKIYSIDNIPDNCEINGNLNLSFREIEKLPENLVVNGYVDMSFSRILQMPDQLTVNGHLYLESSNIKRLPMNIFVKEELDLRDSDIEEIPDNLTCSCLCIDRDKFKLVKKSMNFNSIYYAYKTYKKDEFFRRFENLDSNLDSSRFL